MTLSPTRAGRYVGPPGDTAEYWLPRDISGWEASWAAHQGVAYQPDLDDLEAGDRGYTAPDMSPDAVEARRIAKAREAEALAYVRDYHGTWGLPLDIRSDPRWGSKHHHLSERQVEALLSGKARDAARITADDDLTVWLKGLTGASGFLASVRSQVMAGRGLSPRQREVAEDIRARSNVSAAIPGEQVTEGMYQAPDGAIFKVQVAKLGSGHLYAKRLVVDEEDRTVSFEYLKGGLRLIKAEWRMTVEQAAAFGKLYGICCVCGKDLTDEKSIAAGIGPVCILKLEA